MIKLRKHSTDQVSHEDLFLERYERLLAFARQLRDVDAQRAEDIVHDAFVQFIVCRPPLDRIENLDGYLQRMARNLQLSEIRRRASAQSLTPETVEHETAAAQLQALKDRESRVAASGELRATCRYAIIRKESSRAGSALILRFFHGYHIHEIAQILRTRKQPVYDLIRIARREARMFRESGERLSFIAQASEDTAIKLPDETSEDGELIEGLRDAIFNSCRTACSPVRQLRRLYRRDDEMSIDATLAAHIVSCRRCLEEINRALGLRPLQDRFPTDTLGPGASSEEKKDVAPPKRKQSTRDWIAECRERAEEIDRHEPEELLVSVNGFILVRQTVSGGISEQTTSINLAEPIGFVEIFCEHGLRLAFFNVEPPTEGVAEKQWQQWQINFGGGRTLELSLNFERPWPQLHVLYQAPAPGNAFENARKPEAPDFEDEDRLDESLNPHHRGVLDWLRTWNPFFRPLAIALSLSLFLIVALVWLARRETTVSAAALVERSAAAEAAAAPRPGEVTRRRLELETRDGQSVTRQRLEIWQGARAGDDAARQARRLYDERGALIQGSWTLADGRRLNWRRKGTAARDDQFDDLSAQRFAALLRRGGSAQATETSSDWLISWQASSTAPPSSNDLRQATLKLRKADLHALELTWVVSSNPRLIEYRLTETLYERRRESEVEPAVFEPDRELIGSSETGNDNSSAAVERESAKAEALPPATAALEIEALRLLNGANAGLNEQLEVKRAPQGRIRVEAILDTEERRAELLTTLAPLRGNPAFEIDLQTVAEAVARRRRGSQSQATVSSDTVIEREEIAGTAFTADSELRRFFGARGLNGAALETEIRNFAAAARAHSFRARSHATALKQLATRFSAEELSGLDAAARAQWLGLLRGHARQTRDSTLALRDRLAPVFMPPDADGEKTALINSDDELRRACEQLAALCAESDRIIYTAFTVLGSPGATIGAPGFWQRLRRIERLAEAISETKQL